MRTRSAVPSASARRESRRVVAHLFRTDRRLHPKWTLGVGPSLDRGKDAGPSLYLTPEGHCRHQLLCDCYAMTIGFVVLYLRLRGETERSEAPTRLILYL